MSLQPSKMVLPPNHMYQYSLVNALMSGVSSSGISVSALLEKGPASTLVGLGTFNSVRGEMMLLNGSCYQMLPGDRLNIAKASDECPFVTLSNFEAEQTFANVTFSNKADLDKLLSQWFPESANAFLSYRMTGRFSHVKCRTVEGKENSTETLIAVAAKQVVEDYEDIEGDIVAYRSPDYWQGLGVAGQHLHFISRDRSKGGHILDLNTGKAGVEVQVAVIVDVHMELPRSVAFSKAEMKTDDIGLRKIEG